jgi:predicted outer membrane lipoprotein
MTVFGYHARFLKGLVLAAAFAAIPALAAPLTDAQIFAGYVKSPRHNAFLAKAFNDTEAPPLKARCARLKIAALDSPSVIQPPEFAQIGREYIPSVGRWVQRATLNRCGAKVVRRLLLVADPQTGDLHAFGLLPGEFPGNLQLENDASRIVLSGEMGTAHCSDTKKVFVLDTKLTSPARAQGWTETWTTQVCGKTATIDVIYTADATGMNVTARNLKWR